MSDISLKRLVAEKGTEKSDMFSRIKEKLSSNVLDSREIIEPADSMDQAVFDPQNMDKDTLQTVNFPGEFLKPCPGTNEYICCGYQILQVGTNCPFDCSYCILQGYVNQPSLRVFVNLKENLEKIEATIKQYPEKIFRIGTGEFTDSLALNGLTGWSDILVPFFSFHKNAFLELKTKTDQIDELLNEQESRGQVIVSWSLNGPEIATFEEKGAPSIKKRLIAASKCQEKGYALGFHFDPLIEFEGWEENYLKTIDLMNKYIDPDGILWISLGCLRFMPHLKEIIKKRHPRTKILDGEFIKGFDGKMRYFKPIRIKMYRFIADNLKKWKGDNRGIYLCMESDEVWEQGLGWSPKDSDGLCKYLDERAADFFKSV